MNELLGFCLPNSFETRRGCLTIQINFEKKKQNGHLFYCEGCLELQVGLRTIVSLK